MYDEIDESLLAPGYENWTDLNRFMQTVLENPELSVEQRVQYVQQAYERTKDKTDILVPRSAADIKEILGNPLLNLQERFTVMTKEEMFKEMKEMEPVLGRGGIDIVLGKRIPGSFTMGYFFNEEAGLWEVYFCGERNDYYIEKQTGSEQEAVEELYQIAKYEYESALRHLERERQRKERMQNGQK